MNNNYNPRALGTIWAVIAFTTVLGAVVVMLNLPSLPATVLRCVLGLASAIAVIYGAYAGKKIGIGKFGRIAGWLYGIFEALGVVVLMLSLFMASKSMGGSESGDAIHLVELIVIIALGIYGLNSMLWKSTAWLVVATMIITYIITVFMNIPFTLSVIKIILWSVITILSLAQTLKK